MNTSVFPIAESCWCLEISTSPLLFLASLCCTYSRELVTCSLQLTAYYEKKLHCNYFDAQERFYNFEKQAD